MEAETQYTSTVNLAMETHPSKSRRNGGIDDEDTRCGLGPCSGSWLQRFATRRSYLFMYSFLGVFQAMFFSYSIATLTTLEKQFRLKSQTTGILLSGNEVSQILLSLLMTYFGGHGHRPRLAAIGVAFSGISSLLIVVPHFQYGRFSSLSTSNGNQVAWGQYQLGREVQRFGWVTLIEGCRSQVTRNLDVCYPSSDYTSPTASPDECDLTQSIGPMVYIFMSQFVSGIGTTMFSILGITYLDDNVKRKQTPMLIGLMSALRLIGPALGYALASVCIRMYVNLTEKTTLKPTDPSWIGAWWLGFMIIGFVQLGTGWLLACYPRRLPLNPTAKGHVRTASKAPKMDIKQRRFKDFPAALRRLLTNKILILNNLSGVFFVFALSGYITFLPKYMETQFQQSAARSGLVNGVVSILFMCTGLLLAGYLISKFQPKAWKLQVWDVMIGLVWVVALIAFAYIGCDSKPIHGIHDVTQSSDNILMGMPTTPCNEDCHCQANRFAPACASDELVNFFSACHAGCKTVNVIDGKTVFSDCSCIRKWRNSTTDPSMPAGSGEWVNGEATGGYCPSNCFQVFLIYVLIMGVVKFFSSAGRVSNMIITFRCVPSEDKSFAIGLGYLFVSLFAFIPAPIAYGAVIDQACVLWRTDKCGEKGNCWIYDQEKMRFYLHIMTAGVVMIAIIIDCFVCWAVRDLDLYSEDEPEEDKAGHLIEGSSAIKELQPMIHTRQETGRLTEDLLLRKLEN